MVLVYSVDQAPLFSPLIESLKHEMTLNPDNKLNIQKDISLNNSINNALTNEQLIPKILFSNIKKKLKIRLEVFNEWKTLLKIGTVGSEEIILNGSVQNFGKLIDAEENGPLLKFTLLGLYLLQLEHIKKEVMKIVNYFI